MKKKILFLPLIISMLPLAGCRDYQYDSPNAVFRNRDGKVYVKYKLESKSEESYIKDEDNIIINGLKNAKGVGNLNSVFPHGGDCLEFEVSNYVKEKWACQTDFSLYPTGDLFYRVLVPTSKSFTFTYYHYKYDASVATNIFDKMDVKFKEVQAYEQELLTNFTSNDFIDFSKDRNPTIRDYYTGVEFNDDGRLHEELKNLSFTPIERSAIPEDWEGFAYRYRAFPYTERGIEYKGTRINRWMYGFDKDGKYVIEELNFDDAYGRYFSFTNYYELDQSSGSAFIEKIKEVEKDYQR